MHRSDRIFEIALLEMYQALVKDHGVSMDQLDYSLPMVSWDHVSERYSTLDDHYAKQSKRVKELLRIAQHFCWYYNG